MIPLRAAVCVLCLLAFDALAQQRPRTTAPTTAPKTLPPPGNAIPADDRKALEAGVDALAREIEALRVELANKPQLLALLPDVQIYQKAVDWPLRFKELIDVKKARAALATGAERAKQLRAGQSPWLVAGGPRAYVSKIDGSIQPYLVAMPQNFDPKGKAPYRLDFMFHGRSENLTELNFITGKGQEGPTAPTDARRFVVYPYGRYCVANKFAGEVDTFEVLEAMRRQYPIDLDRVLVTGFSMGGAAVWHHAVHYADQWAAASPGAGFAETRAYQGMDKSGEWAALPWYQRRLMHLYDCTDYALNLSMLPTVAYAGELDRQRQSGDVMEKAMADLGYKLERVMGPKTEHKYEPGAKKEIERRLAAYAEAGRNRVPRELRFATYTLRYNRMHWLTVDGLERHWAPARVDAQLTDTGATVKTSNVSALTLTFDAGQSPFAARSTPTLTIDGATVTAAPVNADKSWTATFVKGGNGWQPPLPKPDPGPRKQHGLQGPIDDAFLDAFLIVKPSRPALSPKLEAWTKRELEHASVEWRKIFRGEPREKNDAELTDADIAANNLVLFGDPSSNAVLARIADKLPIKWTKESIALGDRTFPAEGHALICIYPNPLNPTKYVVLNSGFTFRQADHRTNSRQIAKLPDYAVVDLATPPNDKAPGAIPVAGFFDERWRLQKDDGKGAAE